MDVNNPTLDTIFLVVGAVLILLTGMRLSRRRSEKKSPMEGQRAATIGILIWLGLMGVALYMVFG
jgi:hypothetical protein